MRVAIHPIFSVGYISEYNSPIGSIVWERQTPSSLGVLRNSSAVDGPTERLYRLAP